MPRYEANPPAQSAHVAVSGSQSGHPNAASSPPRLSRVFTGHHLDDQSHYHQDDDRRDGGGARSVAHSGSSVDIEKEDDQASRGTAAEEDAEAMEHTVNEHDVEAPLEKIRTTRSVRDPDLVCKSLILYRHKR